MLVLIKCYFNDRKALAVPIVDSMKWDTLEHRTVYASDRLYSGIFEWGFLYKEQQVSQKTLDMRQRKSEPYW